LADQGFIGTGGAGPTDTVCFILSPSDLALVADMRARRVSPIRSESTGALGVARHRIGFFFISVWTLCPSGPRSIFRSHLNPQIVALTRKSAIVVRPDPR
jgi:hypothetical protein